MEKRSNKILQEMEIRNPNGGRNLSLFPGGIEAFLEQADEV